MPEDNRFAGLGEAVDDEGSSAEPEAESETEPSADDSSSESTSETVEYDSADDADTDTEVDDSADDTDTADEGANSSDSNDPSAFPFDATKKKTVYVRPETLEELEDARALVDAQLRTQHDVRNLTGREFYDAVFRYAAADTDGLIEEILEARDE
ncbi:hypothetical protein [Natronorubrum daqingense]|uniref:Uncharacterized protein n=1 Tax=Natronorubrum daqingense TaxID=588898 RepID=A0A1N7FH34_9EURY|nr:hypothetical protein [Natronorubrum daqingense]APX98435.1 hypothetical protein BB347_17165 [Natronorubrum daqingense]SIR99545.1 hypothetical protein SAMN05421809_3217 [Natronorubrum daqingense]